MTVDPIVLATVAALHIPGGTGWLKKEESLHDIELVAEMLFFEGRNRGDRAQAGLAYSLLDRGSFHSASASVPDSLARKNQFPWHDDKHRARRQRLTATFGLEQLAWQRAVMTATLVYASDEKMPLVRRPCPGNPTMFDDLRNMKRRAKKDPKIGRILAKGCIVDGIVFWDEGMGR